MDIFEELPEIYDSMIDWDRRLAREENFFRPLFLNLGAKRILDAACGTGRHAALFRSWGLEVEGADASAEMIRRAELLHGRTAGLDWVVRSFDEPAGPERFDAAVCLGNSLALAQDEQAAARAAAVMASALRAGGVLVVQAVNLFSLADGPCRWQKSMRRTVGGAEVIIVKGIHRSGSRGFVDLLVIPPESPGQFYNETVSFLGLSPELLRKDIEDLRPSHLEFLGDYSGAPFDPARSADLIMILRR